MKRDLKAELNECERQGWGGGGDGSIGAFLIGAKSGVGHIGRSVWVWGPGHGWVHRCA